MKSVDKSKNKTKKVKKSNSLPRDEHVHNM